LPFLRPILYFAISISCVLFSMFIIAAQKILKINRIFSYLGWYLFFISIVSNVYAFFVMDRMIPYSRELLIIQRMAGLCGGFWLIMLIRSIKKDLLKKIHLVLIFALLGLLFTIAFIDLFFDRGWLFLNPPPRINATLFFKAIYIPFSLIGLYSIYIILFIVLKNLPENNRKLVKIIYYGIICQTPFMTWDFVSLLIMKDPFNSTLHLYNPGIMLTFVFVFIFIVSFINMHIKYGRKRNGSFSSEMKQKVTEYDRRLYDRISSMMLEDKLYYDSDITIEKLAELCGETRNNLSRIINLFSGNNFKAYLNSFRIEEMKGLLLDPDQQNSILEIGLRVGFNSKTSINRAFHHFIKMTPKQFREKSLGKITDKTLPIFNEVQ